MTIPPLMIEKLANAKRVVVLTGAGISAESGVPTFRDAQTGLWAKYRPEELATPRAFQKNPRLVWEWYAWRRQLVKAASPNPGHLALAVLQTIVPEFCLVTQNVDGLHEQAGSRNVIELHGNIQRTKCSREGTIVTQWAVTDEVPPRCESCGAFLRPDVVWFEEPLPEKHLAAAVAVSRNCEVFFSVGTSSVVYPAASLPYEALDRGASLVEINPDPTPVTAKATWVLNGPAGLVLPEIVKQLQQFRA